MHSRAAAAAVHTRAFTAGTSNSAATNRGPPVTRRRSIRGVTNYRSNESSPISNGNSYDELLTELDNMKRETEWVPAAVNSPSPTPPHSPSERWVPSYRAELAMRGYLPRESLGSGTYSKVKSAYRISRRGGQKRVDRVAVKIIDRAKAPQDYQQKFLPRELEIWPTLHHPHIIQLHHWFTDANDRRIFMILQLAPNGDCLRYIQKHGPISEDLARVWTSQTVSAVLHMHQRCVCHRDLKLENLLLDSSHNIRLGDFGFVRYADATSLSQTYCGSKSYAAPEILKGEPHDPRKADVWAIGVVLYIFITGRMPFDETVGNKRLLENQKRLTLHWTRARRVSEGAKALILECFTYDFRLRPTMEEIANHLWMTAPPDSGDATYGHGVSEHSAGNTHSVQTTSAGASSRVNNNVPAQQAAAHQHKNVAGGDAYL